MRPLGYYGLNLDISTETAIDNMPLAALVDLLDDIANQMICDHYLEDVEFTPNPQEGKPVTPDELSDIEKIGLIRGLCDRIELKLMEAAK